MNRMLKSFMATGLLLVCNLVSGALIDFEGVAPAGGGTSGFTEASPHFEDGYVVFGESAENAILSATTTGINSNGSDVFGWCGECASMYIVVLRDDESPFNLLSFDATDLLFTDQSGFTAGDLHIEGFFADGGSVGITIDLSATWTTYNLPSSFSNLDGVGFFATPDEVRDLAIDNIVVSAVPVPAAVWLFGSGLLGVIAVARRRS